MAESELLKITGVGPKAAKTLEDCGFNTIEKITKATAEELSGLPGIGKATAEKIIANAKELESAAKPAAKPETEITKESIPKPKAVKTAPKPAVKSTDPKPSVKKPAAKPAAKPASKAPVKKPAKKPTKKPTKETPIEEKSVYVKTKVSVAAQKAIDTAPEMKTIKKQTSTKKSKPTKKAKISKTYGIVNNVLHDKPGRSSNRSIVLKLYNTEIPIYDYLGRKVVVAIPNTTRKYTGVITRIHGKKSSEDNTVIVRFNRSVSPHIITARATIE